eukprot:s4310_g3.t1
MCPSPAPRKAAPCWDHGTLPLWRSSPGSSCAIDPGFGFERPSGDDTPSELALDSWRHRRENLRRRDELQWLRNYP